MPTTKITIEVGLDDISNLIEFAEINLDMLNLDDFEDYRKSLCAVRNVVTDARFKVAKASARRPNSCGMPLV